MQAKTKRLALFSAIGASAAMVLSVIAISSGKSIANLSKGKASTYAINLSESNGAAEVSSLKTNIATAQTAAKNTVRFDYKNMKLSSGNIGTLSAEKNGFKAYYGNHDAIWAMSHIVVHSDALPGDAVLKAGKTSACLDYSVDLSVGEIDAVNVNFFKIEATNEVTIQDIGIDFECDNSEDGFEATYGSSDSKSYYEFVADGEEFTLKNKTDYSLTRIVIPDNHEDGFYGPVTKLSGKSGFTGSYGFFEVNGFSSAPLAEVHIPETVTGFGNWFFDGDHYDSLTSFTYPRDLTTVGGTSGKIVPISNSLKEVHYNAKNFTYTGSAGFSSSNQPNLEKIFVSADVESLPNNMVSSFPEGLTIVYEGSTSEWNALVSSAANWNTASYVICNDTTTATVSLSFAGGTLGDFVDSRDIIKVVGSDFANPGNPVPTDTSKKFDGWYASPNGEGGKITFPFEVTGDVTLYAYFTSIPQGYTKDNPIIATKDVTYSFSTDASARYAYIKYTASAAGVFYAEVNNWVSSGSFSYKVYDSEGAEVSISYSNGASNDVKATPTSCSSSDKKIKVRMSADQAYTFCFGNATKDATFDLVIRDVDAGKDYTSASVLTDGVTFNYEVDNYGIIWQQFTPSVSGDYYFHGEADKWAAASIGTIADNTFTCLTGNNYSLPSMNSSGGSSRVFSLTAGTTYYIGTGANNDGTHASVSVTANVPETLVKSTAKALTVDGEAATVEYFNNYTYPKWYKFTAASAGTYMITGSKNIVAATASTNFGTSQSTAYIGLFSYDAMEEETFIPLSAQGDTKLYASLAAGEYFIKAAVSSSNTGYTIAVSKLANLTLSFESNGGSSVSDIATQTGLAITAPADPTKANHRFDGWYLDDGTFNNAFDFSAGITVDTTVYAKWVEVRVVTLHYNNGEPNGTDLADLGDTYSPETPSYAGHAFLGWFYDSELNNAFDPTEVVDSDFDLYASWKVQHYTNSAAAYIEESVSDSTTYLNSWDASPKGIVVPSDSGSTYADFAKYEGHANYGTGIKSTIEGVSSQYCRITLNFKAKCEFTFDYAISSESATYDWFKVFVNTTSTAYLTKGGSLVEESATITVEANQYIMFEYHKDSGGNSGLDAVYIYNMQFKTPAVKLSSITLDASLAPTEFALNDTFSSTGLVVTANYDNDTHEVVTGVVDSSNVDMTVEGIYTVEVSFTAGGITKTASYKVRVGNAAIYTDDACEYIAGLANANTYLKAWYDDGVTSTGTNAFAKYADDPNYGTGIKSTIEGQNSKKCQITLVFKADCRFSFSVHCSSESSYRWDYFHCDLNGTEQCHAGGTSTEMDLNTYVDVKAGDVLTLTYQKDSSTHAGGDIAYIYNIVFGAAV